MAIDKNNETAEVTEAELDSEKFDLKQLPEIKLLLEAAKKTGTLDNSEMEKVVEKLEMEPEDIELIYALLQKEGVEVSFSDLDIEINEDDIELSDEEIDKIEEENQKEIELADAVSVNDPVRLYLKEIGKVPLLTR
ncbi:MAG: polymerase primary sigma factor [Eubacteriaceae bacterium]|nr:polymerase primary sigma factor [Eubacteriaceae bacterium]